MGRLSRGKVLIYIEHAPESVNSMKVKVINIWENPTAIYLYSRKLTSVDDRNISVLDEYLPVPGSNRAKRKLQMEVDSYFNGLFLKNKLKNGAYDILHYSDPMIPPARTGKTSVITVHDTPDILLHSGMYFSDAFSDRMTKKFLKRNMGKYAEFKNVITNSNYVGKSLLEYGFTGNIETIYHPVNPHFKKLEGVEKLRN